MEGKDDNLISGETSQEGQCDNKSNGNSTQKETTQAQQEGNGPDTKRGINVTSIAGGLTGFVLASFLFMFLWWLQEQFERFHINGYIVAGIVCFLFLIGIFGIAWLLIEILGSHKTITGAAARADQIQIRALPEHRPACFSFEAGTTFSSRRNVSCWFRHEHSPPITRGCAGGVARRRAICAGAGTFRAGVCEDV